MKTQPFELEKTSVWQRIFLQSKVNGAPYEEQQLGFKWRWPENTYLQRRLRYLRTYRAPTELWEAGHQNMAKLDFGAWSSVLGDGAAPTDRTPEDPTYIDMASDDWTWCASPNTVQRDCHS
jgi:hypothetical protein